MPHESNTNKPRKDSETDSLEPLFPPSPSQVPERATTPPPTAPHATNSPHAAPGPSFLAPLDELNSESRSKKGLTPQRHAAFIHLANELLARPKAPRLTKIAKSLGVTRQTIDVWLKDPDFETVFEERRAILHGPDGITQTIKDELADSLMRDTALATRGRTLLASIAEEVQSRINNNNATSKDLEVGVRTATEAMRRQDRQEDKNTSKNEVNIGTVNITSTQAAAIYAADQEAGVDITDIVRRKPVDVEVVEPADGD